MSYVIIEKRKNNWRVRYCCPRLLNSKRIYGGGCKQRLCCILMSWFFLSATRLFKCGPRGYLRSVYAAALWSGLTVIVFIITFFSQPIWHTVVFLISDKVCLSFLIFLIYSMQNVRFLANFITEAGIIIKRSKVKMRPYTRINACVEFM